MSIDCWADFVLGDANILFQSSVLGTPTAQTRFHSALTGSGLFLVAEEFRSTGGGEPLIASAAANAYADGALGAGDFIRIP
jgi:hypothetical protein